MTMRVPTLHEPQAVISNIPYHRVSNLLTRLSAATPRRSAPIRLVIAPDSRFLCTDGGTIYADPVFTDALSDEELLGALAHELAHGDLGHGGKRVVASTLTGALVGGLAYVLTGGQTGIGTVLGREASKALVVAQYSQAQEVQADRQGAIYLNVLGYNGPAVMIGVLSKIQAMGGDLTSWWFSTHPSSPQRIASMQKFQSSRPELFAAGGGMPGLPSTGNSVSGTLLRNIGPITSAVPSVSGGVGGGSPQRGLSSVPPSQQTSQPSPPVVAKAEGEVVSMYEADGGSMAIEIKMGDNSIVPVIVGPGSVVHLDEKNVTFQPYKVIPGMLASAEYVFDPQRNRSFASSLRLVSHEPETPPGVSPDKQRPLEAQIAGLYSSARRKLGFPEKPEQQDEK